MVVSVSIKNSSPPSRLTLIVHQWHERAKAYEHALAKYAFRMASNDVLPESEATEIECSLLPSIKGEELAIEQEMTRLRAQLADLQSRKDTFSRLSDACRMLISPIRRLPADLILEVFKFRFAEDSAENGHAGRYHLFHVNEGPWVFSSCMCGVAPCDALLSQCLVQFSH